MTSLLEHKYPRYHSELRGRMRYAPIYWPKKEYRNWNLQDNYWYDCYMNSSAKNVSYNIWNYPYSSWLTYNNHMYDLPSIYPSYYSMHHHRYNDNARYQYYHNYFTYYSPLNRLN